MEKHRGALAVELVWRLGRGASVPVTVFIHLYDSTGRLVAGHDTPLGQGDDNLTYAPFELRRQGDLISERSVLELPASIPSAEYAVGVGLHEPVTVQCLVARLESGEALPDNVFIINQVTLP